VKSVHARTTWNKQDVKNIAWAIVGLTHVIEFIGLVMHGPRFDWIINPVVLLEIALQPRLKIGLVFKEGVEGF
jgi:hypothetical protein